MTGDPTSLVIRSRFPALQQPTSRRSARVPRRWWPTSMDGRGHILGDRAGVVVVVPRGRLAAVAAGLDVVAAPEAEMPAKLAAGEIRSPLEPYRELCDPTIWGDRARHFRAAMAAHAARHARAG